MLQKEIEARLADYHDPYLEKDWVAAKAIKNITVTEDRVRIDIVLGYAVEGVKKAYETALKAHLSPVAGGKMLDIHFSSQIEAHVGKQGIAALPQIKNIIAVASGKGGVGKSTVAINLALALAREGAKVGILDADIYGPSQPSMLGAQGERPVIKDKTISPIVRHGIQSMSIGYLVDGNAAMMWRGPMLGKALEQLIYDTTWEDLDYLIVDLPPGTGDVQLTLCQKIPLSGAVMVTTPQDMALLDVRRACEMFNKLNVPLLGVVENMSVYHCPQCGHEQPVFGEGGAKKLAEQYGLSLLGSIPLDSRIREMTDSGYPPVVQDPESDYARVFCETARKTAAKLALQPKDYSSRFPKIVVKRDEKE